ncbi:unnamed protein product [Arabis nemorensis]|uniref:Uncharacterized protein n=1 Tax=Arabis nemorensis TaxID=586526 RepID=A0A565CRC3_9BRAS|nr:unnamed protein product [Arabis nemorensis]
MKLFSPIKEFVVEAHKEKKSGPRARPRNLPKGPTQIEQRISKAHGVKKTIGKSPFRGSLIHKHSFLAKEDPTKGDSALNGVADPVVKGKPPAAA